MREQAEKIIEVTSQSLGVGSALRAPERPAQRPAQRPLVRRHATGTVQDLWRRHGWVPPTELGKNFRAALRTTASV